MFLDYLMLADFLMLVESWCSFGKLCKNLSAHLNVLIFLVPIASELTHIRTYFKRIVNNCAHWPKWEELNMWYRNDRNHWPNLSTIIDFSFEYHMPLQWSSRALLKTKSYLYLILIISCNNRFNITIIKVSQKILFRLKYFSVFLFLFI